MTHPFGSGLAGAYALGSLLREGRSGFSDLGPAPIGSDPWLHSNIAAAIERERDVDASQVRLHVQDAIVTVSGTAADAESRARIEAAARTVQGIKRLEITLTTR